MGRQDFRWEGDDGEEKAGGRGRGAGSAGPEPLLSGHGCVLEWGGLAGLSARAFLVWVALEASAAPTLTIASASHEKLRRMIKRGSKATVKSALAELAAKGYIRLVKVREHKPQYARIYRLVRQVGTGGTEVEDMIERCLTDPPEEAVQEGERCRSKG